MVPNLKFPKYNSKTYFSQVTYRGEPRDVESHELAVPYGIRAAGPGYVLAAGPGLQARVG